MKKAIVVIVCLTMLALVFSCDSDSGGGGKKPVVKPDDKDTLVYTGVKTSTDTEYVLEVKDGAVYTLTIDDELWSWGTVKVTTDKKSGEITSYTCTPDADFELPKGQKGLFTVVVAYDDDEEEGVIISITGIIYAEDGEPHASPGTLFTVASFTLSSPTLDLGVGEDSDKLSVTPSTPVTWSTSDAKVATVDKGVVTGVKVGTATITATASADSTKKASCTVTVVDANAVRIKINTQGPIELDADGEGNPSWAAIDYEVINGTTDVVNWTSDKPAVAVVDAGAVYAVGKGTAIITATSADDTKAKATITVVVTKLAGGIVTGDDGWLWYVMSLTEPNPNKIRGQSIFSPGEASHIDATRAEYPDEETGLYGWVPNEQTDPNRLKDNNGATIEERVFNFKGETKVVKEGRGPTEGAQFPLAGWGAIPWPRDTGEKALLLKKAKGYKFWYRVYSSSGSGYCMLTAIETDQFDPMNGFDFRHWFGLPANNTGGANGSKPFTTGGEIGQWKQITVYLNGNQFNMDQDSWIYNYTPAETGSTTVTNMDGSKTTVAWKNPKQSTLQQGTAKQLQWQIPLQHQKTAAPPEKERNGDPYDVTNGTFAFDIDFYGLELFE